jgi:hypothetical protein
MYLAGLIADETKITKTDLRKWVKRAYWSTLTEYTVAWIAAESSHGMELAREWIPSRKETIASAGWSTLSNLVSIKPDEELNLRELENYLKTVGNEINRASNRVRYTMNGYVIAAGAYVASLTEKALKVARKIGKVTVDMGETACKVPGAVVEKIKEMGRIGKKRKMARC